MNRKIKWGIIAAGGIAMRRTLPAMQFCHNAEIVAAMDKNVECLKQIKETFGVEYIYDSEEELLNNSEVEAVYVASPVCFHKEQAMKVLDAGKHLLLEKPIGLTLQEAQELKEYADKTNLVVGVGMVMKMHDGHQKIHDLIQKGMLGQIISCRAQLTCWFPEMENNWRQSRATSGGGALVDMGIHCIDLLRYLLEDDVDKVYGDVATKTFRYEVDDSADCMLHMKKGANCFVDVHFNIPDNAAKGILEIYGTKGSIIATGTIGQESGGEILLTLSEQTNGYNSQQDRGDGHMTQQLIFDKENIYAKQISQISDAILNDGKAFTTMNNALETMKVIDALYCSAKEERAIRI